MARYQGAEDEIGVSLQARAIRSRALPKFAEFLPIEHTAVWRRRETAMSGVAVPPQASTGDAASIRPRSLKDVATHAAVHGNIDAFLREFLDEFYSEPSLATQEAMLQDEPPLDAANPRANAYLAAVAEHLARSLGLAVPGWSEGADRFLHRAYFPSGLESLKATLLAESPAAFRRRMIFVGADPLDRPRRHVPPLFGEQG